MCPLGRPSLSRGLGVCASLELGGRFWRLGYSFHTMNAHPHPITLIHGGNGAPKAMAPLGRALGERQAVWCPPMLGHAGREVPQSLSVPDMVDDLLRQMDAQGIARSFVGGYSFGGYVALYLARHHPDRCLGVFTLATKVVFDERAVRHLVHLTSPTRVEQPGHAHADDIRQRHLPQDWRTVILANQALFRSLGEAPPLTARDWADIRVPALVASGQADPLVPLAETQSLAGHLRAQLVLFPGSAHPLTVVPVQALAHEIGQWMGRVRDGDWPPR